MARVAAHWYGTRSGVLPCLQMRKRTCWNNGQENTIDRKATTTTTTQIYGNTGIIHRAVLDCKKERRDQKRPLKNLFFLNGDLKKCTMKQRRAFSQPPRFKQPSQHHFHWRKYR